MKRHTGLNFCFCLIVFFTFSLFTGNIFPQPLEYNSIGNTERVWKQYQQDTFPGYNRSKNNSNPAAQFFSRSNAEKRYFSYNKADKLTGNSQSYTWEKIGGPEGGSVRGIYEYSGKLYLISDREVYKYEDNKWIPLNFGSQCCNIIYHLLVDNSGKIMVVTDYGLSYSADGGKSWYFLLNILSDCSVYNITETDDKKLMLSTSKGIRIFETGEYSFKPYSLDTMLVSTVAFDHQGNIWAGSQGKIYRASCTDLQWEKVMDTEGYFNKILFDSKGAVYINNDNYVFRSRDLGKSWEYLTGRYICDITLDSADALIITEAYWISKFTGNYMEWTSSKLDAFLLNAFVYNDELLTGTLGSGVLKYSIAEDKLTGFNKGFYQSTIRGIEPLADGTLIAVTDADSIYSSADSGKSWRGVSAAWSRFMKQSNDSTVYSGAFSGMIKSRDSGRTWETLDINVEPFYISCFDIGEDNRTICAGSSTGDVFISRDGGSSFKQVKTGNYVFTDAVKILKDYSILIQLDTLFLTKDMGKTFIPVLQNDLPHAKDIAQNKDGLIFLASYYDIYKSADCLHWEAVKRPPQEIQYLRFDPYDNLYVVCNEGGVSRSSDNGNSWESVTPTILNTFIWSFALCKDGTLYAGSQDQGLYSFKTTFRNKDDKKPEEELPNSYYLSDNFPNPFNNETKLRFEIHRNSFVTITIYDILGRKLETVVSELYPAGMHTVKWNASRYSSGVYQAVFKADNYISVKKMILIK